MKGKIGVFDSGFGGLSILKEIVKVLPEYDYIYLGDNARAPYGDKSQETIFEYTKEGIDFLFEKGAEIIILACNSTSSEALRKIQQEYLPLKYPDKRVLGVIIPAAEDAVRRTLNGKVGVLGTVATISSHAFDRELLKLDPKLEVFEVAAPLLVPLVESGEEGSVEAKQLIKEYTDKFPKEIDTLILGCTHYGFFETEIEKCLPHVAVVSEGGIVAEKLKEYFLRHPEIESLISKKSALEFFTTGSIQNFDFHGSRFFGNSITSKSVDLPR